MLANCFCMLRSKSSTKFDKHISHECLFKHAAAGVICHGASMLPTSFLHGGSFQLERCKTQRVVSAGRYQTESRWFSSCVKSYVGTLSLETSDISMLHNSCNRFLYIVLYHNYSLPTYLPCYLLHMKAGPRLPTSGDSNYFGSDPKLPKFKQTQACHWNKFGSKCAFGADMSSKTSAPGTSCSKETVLRIGFMNHHRDCWAQKNICEHQNEAERLACALLHVFAEKGLWQGRLEGQGFRRLAPIRMPAFISLATLRALSDKSLAKHSTALRKITEAVVFIKNVYETHARSMMDEL